MQEQLTEKNADLVAYYTNSGFLIEEFFALSVPGVISILFFIITITTAIFLSLAT